MSEREQLEAGISALLAQRAVLGENVVELALAPLRAQLGRLDVANRSEPRHLRMVSILFADIVGSTAIGRQLDPEDTHAIIDDALQRFAAVIGAHQGRVLRFMGDGLLAAFGADGAREDDPERAVRAGLALLEEGKRHAGQVAQQHGVAGFEVRVGVNTGSVLIGGGVEAENTTMGSTVNIAARMEQTAPPGTLRISHDTWSQVRGLFDLEAQPPLQVKGIDAPMKAYLVRGALERSVASAERGLQGLSTPMVGRDSPSTRRCTSLRQRASSIWNAWRRTSGRRSSDSSALVGNVAPSTSTGTTRTLRLNAVTSRPGCRRR